MLNYNNLQQDFIRLIEKERLSHAYLFFGGNEADREAKIIFAESLANFLENKKFEKPTRPLIELLCLKRDEKGVIGIDEARQLKHFLYQKPINSERRTVVIRHSEDLTPEARNAVLKIVEEPPENSLIIFIARNEDNLPRTLVSRLQKIHFSLSLSNNQSYETKSRKIKFHELAVEELVTDENQLDRFFESLLFELSREPIKNFIKLKEALRRLTFIKQFNTNKKLQLRVLNQVIKKSL